MTMPVKPLPAPDRRWAVTFATLAAVGALGGPVLIVAAAIAAVPVESAPFPHTRFLLAAWGATWTLAVPLYARLALRNAGRRVPTWLRGASAVADAAWIAAGIGVAATNEMTHWLGGLGWTIAALIPFGLLLLGAGNVAIELRRRRTQ